MQLPYKPIDAFEVKGIRFVCVSAWNGLEEWRDDHGRTMIVSRESYGGIARAMAEILGPAPGESAELQLTVIKATPDLIADLQGE